MSVPRARWAWAVRALAAVACAASAEGAARAVLHGRELDPRVFATSGLSPGYALSPGAASDAELLGRDVHITIGPDGRRVTPGAPDDGVDVHVVGDSMIFGWGLDDLEAPPARLQARLGAGVRVTNHGLPGAGPYQYARALEAIPRGAWVVVALTESNDVTDAYRDEVVAGARCGHLAFDPRALRFVPCFVLDLRVVQIGARVHGRLVRFRKATPLQYDSEGRVASRVLGARIDDLFTEARAARGPRLVFAVVPWDASLVPARASTYYPPPALPRPSYAPADDAGTRAAFARVARPDELFLRGDDHLSAAGADLLAETLARALVERGLHAVASR